MNQTDGIEMPEVRDRWRAARRRSPTWLGATTQSFEPMPWSEASAPSPVAIEAGEGEGLATERGDARARPPPASAVRRGLSRRPSRERPPPSTVVGRRCASVRPSGAGTMTGPELAGGNSSSVRAGSTERASAR